MEKVTIIGLDIAKQYFRFTGSMRQARSCAVAGFAVTMSLHSSRYCRRA